MYITIPSFGTTLLYKPLRILLPFCVCFACFHFSFYKVSCPLARLRWEFSGSDSLALSLDTEKKKKICVTVTCQFQALPTSSIPPFNYLSFVVPRTSDFPPLLPGQSASIRTSLLRLVGSCYCCLLLFNTIMFVLIQVQSWCSNLRFREGAYGDSYVWVHRKPCSLLVLRARHILVVTSKITHESRAMASTTEEWLEAHAI